MNAELLEAHVRRVRGEQRLRGELANLVHNPLLRIGRNGRLRLFHRKDDVLLVLCDQGQHRQHQHIDSAGSLPVEGRRVVACARRDKGGDDLAEMFAR